MKQAIKTCKIFRLILCTLLLCALYEKSSAILDLELTQGIAASIPIAVTPFTGEAIQVPGGQSLLDVINHDLQNSGECRVVNPGQNGDYAVSGSITRIGSDRYEIRIQLRSMFKAEKNNTLLEERFETNSASFRAVAHRISDDIYAKLTGIRGIFSTRIAYVVVRRAPRHTQYQLEVADADGFNPRVLLTSAEPIMSPSWSPDAKNIAYVSFEGHRAAIYLQNVATGQRTILSKLAGINNAPAFSPNGLQVALVLSTTGNPNIYLMNITGAQPHALTSGWAIDTEPAFSPDGRSLVFTSNRDGSPQIYQYMLSNGKITRLSFDGNYNACATYTPDGRAIIMMHRDTAGAFGIARLDLASGQTIILTQSGHDESPSIAPNGKMIIYATQYGGRGVLAQVSIDGRIRLRLPAREGSVQEPTWSPFLTQ